VTDTNRDNSPALGGRNARSGREPRLGGENALRHLVISLESDNWRTRREAAIALRKIGGDAVAILIEALAHPNMHTRRTAAHTLGLIGGPEAAEALIGALNDDQPLVQSDVSTALIALVRAEDDPGSRTHILRALLRHCNVRRRHDRTYKVLYAIRDEITQSLIDILLDEDIETSPIAWKLLHDSRTMLAAGLARIPMVHALLESLVNATGAFSLDDLSLLRQTRIELVAGLRSLVEAQDPVEQANILGMLSGYPYEKIASVSRIHARAHEPRIRAKAILRLAVTHDTPATMLVELLTDLLLNDPTAEVRSAVPEKLVQIQCPDALPVIEQALAQEQSPVVRRQLIAALRALDNDKAAAFCLGMVGPDIDESTRHIVIRELTTCLNKSYVAADLAQRIFEFLVESLAVSGDQRILCIRALALLVWRQGHYEPVSVAATNILLGLMREGDPDTRAFAMLQSRHLPVEVAVPALIERLADQGWSRLLPSWRDPARISDGAANILEQIGTPAALAAVERWRRDQNQGPA
jgi:HEAT repeat protein